MAKRPARVAAKHAKKRKYEGVEEVKPRKVVPDRTDYFNRLDNGSLSKIFTYLPPEDRIKCERVCKRWKTAVSESWYDVKKLSILNTFQQWYPGRNWSEPRNHKLIEEVLRRSGRSINKLELVSWNWLENCQNFYEIIKSSCTHNTLDLKLLLKNPTHLSFMKLPDNLNKLYIHVGYSSETPVELDPSVFAKLKNLESLSLNGFSISAEFLNVICDNNNLTEFNVTNCVFPHQSLRRLCYLQSIQKLNFWSIDGITNELLADLASKCTKLKKVLITGECPDLTEDGVSQLISTAPCLEDLTISYCDRVIQDLITIINSYESRFNNNITYPPKKQPFNRSMKASENCHVQLCWKKNKVRRAVLPSWAFQKTWPRNDIPYQVQVGS